MTRTPRCLLAAAVLLAAACTAPAPPPPSAARPSGASAVVDVSNNNWSDMVIYVVHADSRQRLGTVTSMTTTTLPFPRSVLGAGGTLQLMADAIGSNARFSTDRIRVIPGQRVELDIENNLAISSYAIVDR